MATFLAKGIQDMSALAFFDLRELARKRASPFGQGLIVLTSVGILMTSLATALDFT